MNGLEDVDDDVLEGVENLDTGAGVRCEFYVCRRCEHKPRPTVRQSN